MVDQRVGTRRCGLWRARQSVTLSRARDCSTSASLEEGLGEEQPCDDVVVPFVIALVVAVFLTHDLLFLRLTIKSSPVANSTQQYTTHLISDPSPVLREADFGPAQTLLHSLKADSFGRLLRQCLRPACFVRPPLAIVNMAPRAHER